MNQLYHGKNPKNKKDIPFRTEFDFIKTEITRTDILKNKSGRCKKVKSTELIYAYEDFNAGKNGLIQTISTVFR